MSDQYAFNIFTADEDADRAAFPTTPRLVSENRQPRADHPCEAPGLGAFDAMSARILKMSANRRPAS